MRHFYKLVLGLLVLSATPGILYAQNGVPRYYFADSGKAPQ